MYSHLCLLSLSLHCCCPPCHARCQDRQNKSQWTDAALELRVDPHKTGNVDAACKKSDPSCCSARAAGCSLGAAAGCDVLRVSPCLLQHCCA